MLGSFSLPAIFESPDFLRKVGISYVLYEMLSLYFRDGIVNILLRKNILIAFFDRMLYNHNIMKWYAISLITIKKGMLWRKVNI